MKWKKGIMFLAILFIATLSVSKAHAALLDLSYSLPGSSYADSEWEGSKEYKEDGLFLLVEFNVYDTDGGNELFNDNDYEAEDLEAIGNGQYIYAYQIFNHPTQSIGDVSSFELLKLNGEAIDEPSISGIGALNNSLDEPMDEGIEHGGTQPAGIWTWWGFNSGLILEGEHSWFLILSSDSEPIAGKYEINSITQEQQDPGVPDGEGSVEGVSSAPEPATVALLGFGSLTLFLKRRKK